MLAERAGHRRLESIREQDHVTHLLSRATVGQTPQQGERRQRELFFALEVWM